MGAINVRNLSDGAKRKLEVKAAEKGQSLECYIRDVLESLAETSPPKRRVVYDTMHGEFASLKDYDWDAENTEEIEAWEASTLP
jgi:plasmid stability protein